MKLFPTHHTAFKPGYASNNSLSGSLLVQIIGDEEPGVRSTGSFPPYSRYRIIALVEFLTMNRGDSVMTFVNAYFPDPVVQETPK
jgi:hypothetical protein